MGRFVVLLRGVNVGKGNRVPMAEFRALLTALGHGEVQTLLNSGNAVFSSRAREPARLAEGIAAAVQQAFGVTTPVIVKSAVQFDTIVREAPFAVPEAEHPRCLVAFSMAPEALQALTVLQPLAQPGERLVITGQSNHAGTTPMRLRFMRASLPGRAAPVPRRSAPGRSPGARARG